MNAIAGGKATGPVNGRWQ